MRKAALWFLVSAMGGIGMDVEACSAASSCGQNPLVEQEEAVRQLIDRLLPEQRHLFRVYGIRHCGHDHQAAACFEVYVSGGLVHIKGTSGTLHSRDYLSSVMQGPRL